MVQPLLGKYVLPWFGGGSAVWSTCLVFFQVGLLAGYAYAHVLARFLPLRRQVVVHAVAVLVSLAFLPIVPQEAMRPGPAGSPEIAILRFLAGTVGLPYVVLSATSPLMLSWSRAANRGVSPYPLFALSNLGSLLPLAIYPTVLEPWTTRTTQGRLWSAGFCVFAGIAAWSALRAWRVAAPAGNARAGSGARVRRLDRVLWALFPACATVLLLGATRQLTEEVAPVPLLWIAPLGAYLVSFIVCFEWPRAYARAIFVPLTLLAAWGAVRLMEPVGWGIVAQVAIHLAVVFVGCMTCHGELFRLRPDPRALTAYLLTVAAGGAAGSVFFVLVAPRLFTGYVEYEAATLVTCALLALAILREREDRSNGRRLAALLLAAVSIANATGMAERVRRGRVDVVRASRSFFGVLQVVRRNRHDPDRAYTKLDHGRIIHGAQIEMPERRRHPTLYFGEISGIGRLLARETGRPRRVGVVGLGVGTLATYGRAGDAFRFYEIDANVVAIARESFTFLADSAADIEIVLGDGRLSLEREPSQAFDVLVLDAFSGDAVPTHLLTREAFEIYEGHLGADGVIAVNVTNVYLDLRRVVVPLAERLGYASSVVVSKALPARLVTEAAWVLMSRDPSVFRELGLRVGPEGAGSRFDPAEPWTDDYASVFPLLIQPR